MAVLTIGRLNLVAVAKGDSGELLAYDERLTLIKRVPLSGSPRGAASDGAQVFVSTAGPARLYSVTLAGGTVRLLDRADGAYGGDVAVRGRDVVWAVPPTGQLRVVHLASGSVSTLRACAPVQSFAFVPLTDMVMVACVGHPASTAELVDLATGRTELGDLGYAFANAVISG